MTVRHPIADGGAHPPTGTTGDAVFADAFAAARARHSGEAWETLPPGERSAAIYREMRRLDQERAAQARRAAVTTGERRLRLVPPAVDG